MNLRSTFFLALAVALSACAAPSQPNPPDAAHSSRNALDWAGSYEGTLPCADCPGIKTRVTLRQDGSYEVTRTYLDRNAAPRVERGSFAWLPGGNAVQLEGEAGGARFAVGEGRLAWLEPGAAPAWPQPARFVLPLVAPAPKAAGGVQGTLQSNRWTLTAATAAGGKPVSGLPADTARRIVFHFTDGKLAIEGACNRSFGGYRIDTDGRLNVDRMASTLMGCDPQAMKADDQLAALLSGPQRIDFTQGGKLAMRLTNAQGATLEFDGQPTPEARYGKPARVFLEVAPQPVACNNPLTGATSCLQVREIAFDNKGLRIDPPGAWRALYEGIDGYTHQPGVRNVLRLKRFQDKAGASIYVLDMVVESETAKR